MGETPLPKYIDRPVEPDDEDRYQNIFATEEGAKEILDFKPEQIYEKFVSQAQDNSQNKSQKV